MPRADRQRFRNESGARQRTLHLDEVTGAWQHDPAKTHVDTALEEAMKPFLSDLTVKEREALSVMYSAEKPDIRTAAKLLGIQDGALRERLDGRPERRSKGAIQKVREALLAALEPELRRRLEEGQDGAYADLRHWLTPAEHIRADGTEDPWREARCLVCNRPLAQWRPNSILSGLDRYEDARLICAIH